MKRILLVEDDDVARRLLASELSASHSVTEVDSGEAALSVLSAEPGAFAAIVCDVALPGLSGPDALSAASAALGDAALLFLSGYGEPDLSSFPGRRVRSLQKPTPPGAVAQAVTLLLAT